MGFFGLFKPGGDTLKGAGEGLATLAQGISTAITNDIPPVQRGELLGKALDVVSSLAAAHANVIVAEAQGASWLQRNWRPVTMMCFLVMIILNQAGVLPIPLPDQAWTIFGVGIGGYIGSRGLEKIVGMVKK